MSMRTKTDTLYSRIYAVVKCVPRGRLATYGQVALLAGLPGHARLVGYALHALPADLRVPWHRVINAQGEVSARSAPGGERRQRVLLKAEGVLFNAKGRASLARFGWRPRFAPRQAKPRRGIRTP